MTTRHVSRVIHACADAVYSFAAEPENLPRWAAGLARGDVAREGESLVVDSPMGTITVTFVPRNDLGVLDHDVRLPSGETVSNPLRVLSHPDGAEVVFTLRQRDASDEDFEQDAALVEADLERLAGLLEA